MANIRKALLALGFLTFETSNTSWPVTKPRNDDAYGYVIYVPFVGQPPNGWLYGSVHIHIGVGSRCSFRLTGKFEDLKMWSERQGASRFLVLIHSTLPEQEQSERSHRTRTWKSGSMDNSIRQSSKDTTACEQNRAVAESLLLFCFVGIQSDFD